MGWLRLDDKFVDHPKIEALTAPELRCWLRVLCYCAEFQTGGEVTVRSVRTLTTKRVSLYLSLGLLERDENDALFVHDWKRYNPTDPTAASRMQRYRARNAARNTSRNENVTSRAGARWDGQALKPESTNPPHPLTPSPNEPEPNYGEGEGEEKTGIDLTRYWAERERTLNETNAALERLEFKPPPREEQQP